MMLAAGAQALPGAAIEIAGIEFLQLLSFDARAEVPVQVVARVEGDGWRVQVASRSGGAVDAAWTVHARGVVRKRDAHAPARGDLAAWRRELDAKASHLSEVDAASFYDGQRESGVDYGPAFQGVVELRRAGASAFGKVKLPEAAGRAGAFHVHPALLDGLFQVAASALGSDATWVPVRVEALHVAAPLPRKGDAPEDGAIWCKATISRDTTGERCAAELALFDAAGEPVGAVKGFVFQRLGGDAAHRREDAWMMALRWEPAALPAARVSGGRWLVVGDGAGLAAKLQTALEAGGHRVARAPAREATPGAMRELLAKAFGGAAPTGVVHLGSLDAVEGADVIDGRLAVGCDSVVPLVKAIAASGWADPPRLHLVTRGAQAAGAGNGAAGDVDVAQAPLLGMARVLANEHPELRCLRIDLDPSPSQDEAAALHAELIADDGEDEVAWRGAVRSAARLARKPVEDAPARERRFEPATGRPFELAFGSRGSLEDLELRPGRRHAPGPGEVEIEVEAAGLNFRDVLVAMGLLGEEAGVVLGKGSLGLECAGKIAALGAGVTGLQVGQPVMALARAGAMASHVTTPAALVLPRPARFSAAQAATALIAPLTAWYALNHVGRLAKGERVLVHAAGGGVGLAAVQWALHVGAEVYATASSAEKRARLARMGVKHVSDSRSSRFVTDVREWTGGEGVDVVLNSLGGDFIDQSFGLLRPHGRFIELGKRDYQANRAIGMRPFLRNLSFALVDILAIIAERPELARGLLRDLDRLYEAGAITPVDVETFPASRAKDAFAKMARSEHVGKLALVMADPEARVAVADERRTPVRQDASYVITGGLGGLGLSLAEWLAARGAGHVVLAGRGGVTTSEQREAIARVEARGTTVKVARVDVADGHAVSAMLSAIPRDKPLRGVLHAANVLDDGVVVEMTPERMRKVMGPKARGAWNLHELTSGAELDMFVMYGSFAGIVGFTAQSNYAAANTFVDALAHHRRARGLVATSIDWGVFSEVGGAVTSENRGERLARRGMYGMTPREGIAALERVLERGDAQVSAARVDMHKWVEYLPGAAGSRMLAPLLGGAGAAQAGASADAARTELANEIAGATRDKQLEQLVDVVRADVARVLALGRVGAVPPEKPLRDLGLDSLLAVELRNALAKRLGLALPPTLTFDHPTPAAIAAYLLTRMSGQPAAAAKAPAAKAPPPAAAKPANGANGSVAAKTPPPAAVKPANGAHPPNGTNGTARSVPPPAPPRAELAVRPAPAAPVVEAIEVRPDRIERIPMGERWFTDAFRLIPPAGGFAQRAADVSSLLKATQILNEAGVRATLTHAMIRAAALALARNPELHQMVCGYRRLTPGSVDIGMSMAGKTAYAPVVVLHGTDWAPLGALVSKVEESIAAARAKEEVDLANLKKVGWTTPIGFLRRLSIRIMQEMFWYRRKIVGTFQVTCVPTADVTVPLQFYTGGILSFGRPLDTVVAVDGRPAVRPMLTLTVAVDHVALDGMRAAALLEEIIAVVESDELVEEARQAVRSGEAALPESGVKALPPAAVSR